MSKYLLLKNNKILPIRNVNMSRTISPKSKINRLNFISKMRDRFCRTLRKNRDLQKLYI